MKLKTEHIADLEERLSDTTQQLAERETTVHELEGKSITLKLHEQIGK